MLVEFTHVLASSDFVRYYFSRTSGRAENITQIDCDALTSEKRNLHRPCFKKSISNETRPYYFLQSFGEPDL